MKLILFKGMHGSTPYHHWRLLLENELEVLKYLQHKVEKDMYRIMRRGINASRGILNRDEGARLEEVFKISGKSLPAFMAEVSNSMQKHMLDCLETDWPCVNAVGGWSGYGDFIEANNPTEIKEFNTTGFRIPDDDRETPDLPEVITYAVLENQVADETILDHFSHLKIDWSLPEVFIMDNLKSWPEEQVATVVSKASVLCIASTFGNMHQIEQFAKLLAGCSDKKQIHIKLLAGPGSLDNLQQHPLYETIIKKHTVSIF